MPIRKQIEKIIEDNSMKKVEFAKRIKVDPSYISKILSSKEEKEPSERLIDDICHEFNVNEDWLRTGKGQMYIRPSENELVRQASILLGKKDPVFEAFVETYSKLTMENRTVLINFGLDFLKSMSEKLPLANSNKS